MYASNYAIQLHENVDYATLLNGIVDAERSNALGDLLPSTKSEFANGNIQGFVGLGSNPNIALTPVV